MNYYTVCLKRSLLVMIASLLVSCAMSPGDGTPISSGELVNMKGGRSVRAPEGNNWTVKIDEMRGEVSFDSSQDGGKFTLITIGPGYVEPSSTCQTEDQAAALIFDSEERIMRARGSTRSYYLKDVSRERTIIGKKKLYVMKYTISDLSRVPTEIKYAMYLNFPNYSKQPKDYYIFLVGDVSKINNTPFATDLTVINKVIESYEPALKAEYNGHEKIVFLTSTRYDGNLGGISGADIICNMLADSPDSMIPESKKNQNKFKAWISDEHKSPTTPRRFSRSAGAYVLVDGTSVADSFDYIIENGLKNERGSLHLHPNVWTGTTGQGLPTSSTCDGWKTNSHYTVGTVGYAQPLIFNGFWTEYDIRPCDQRCHLYCFEQ